MATEEKIGAPASNLELQSTANETNDSTKVDIANYGKSKKEEKITIPKSNDESVGQDKKSRSGLLSPERLLQTKWNFTKKSKERRTYENEKEEEKEEREKALMEAQKRKEEEENKKREEEEKQIALFEEQKRRERGDWDKDYRRKE